MSTPILATGLHRKHEAKASDRGGGSRIPSPCVDETELIAHWHFALSAKQNAPESGYRTGGVLSSYRI